MKERYDAITIAKAIAIILMVVGHAGCPSALYSFIYMFHMPLFFFVSGYCFNDKYIEEPKRFCIRKIQGIYIPYVKWCLIFLALHNLFVYLGIYNEEYGRREYMMDYYEVTDFLKKTVLICCNMEGYELLVSGFWFLKQLFVGSLIMIMVVKLLKNSMLSGAVVILAASLILSYFSINTPFPAIGSLSFFAATMIIVGYGLKRIDLLNRINNKTWLVIPLIIVVMVSSMCFPTDMLHYDHINAIPYLFVSTLGTIMVLLIAQIATKIIFMKNVLMYIGDHTMAILVWHFFCFKVVHLLIICIEHRSIMQIAVFPSISDSPYQWWILYTIVGVSIPLLIDRLINILGNRLKDTL